MKREECLDIVNKMIADGIITQDDAARYFPELAESKDEKMLDFAIRAVGLCKQYAINHQVNGYSKLPDAPKRYEELQDWLKSLRPQSAWKPSAAQIDALKFYIEKDFIDKEGCFGKCIVKLYEQLKKLIDN